MLVCLIVSVLLIPVVSVAPLFVTHWELHVYQWLYPYSPVINYPPLGVTEQSSKGSKPEK